MGVINQANIAADQFNLLIDVILSFKDHAGGLNPNMMRIYNIAISPETNNDIIITNGVHFSQVDMYGHYHFNIKIHNRGVLE